MFLNQAFQRSLSWASSKQSNNDEKETKSTSSDSGTSAAPTTESSSINSAPEIVVDDYDLELENSTKGRTRLPHKMTGEDGNGLFSLLKGNIGKDLTTVTFPVTYNEPLSLLQRLAEDLEYHDLLEKATHTEDSAHRIALVAAFAISSYACTKHRSGRKPFNPMLGETFELQTESFKFVAEKCSHHPPVMACHGHGEGWEFWATNQAKNKFGGKSFEIVPLGWTHLKVGEDHYRWDKPSSFVRNIISGKDKHFEHVGPMTIENARTGDYVDIEFKEASLWSKKNRNVVTATIFSKDASPMGTIEGTWDGELVYKDTNGVSLELWKCHQFPPKVAEYYGFTSFAFGLNELKLEIASNLPPTDSRWRPDQRALEGGDLVSAEREKVRLEDAQRSRRKRNVDRKPRWFEKVSEGGDDEGQEWRYSGQYWVARETSWVEEQEALW